MKKRIVQFRYEPHGLFIDQEARPAAVAINPQTGRVLLNEGDGEACFQGALFLPEDIQELLLVTEKNKGSIYIKFGQQQSHYLGSTDHLIAADDFIVKANQLLDRHRPQSSSASRTPQRTAGTHGLFYDLQESCLNHRSPGLSERPSSGTTTIRDRAMRQLVEQAELSDYLREIFMPVLAAGNHSISLEDWAHKTQQSRSRIELVVNTLKTHQMCDVQDEQHISLDIDRLSEAFVRRLSPEHPLLVDTEVE